MKLGVCPVDQRGTFFFCLAYWVQSKVQEVLFYGAHMDKCVKFDFEIDFANGGGIQGQDFQLDIAGDDISDEELAEYIVRDMRLLMVG